MAASSKSPLRKKRFRSEIAPAGSAAFRPQVGIVGLGYVGLTTAACLLERKIRVAGYELSKAKRMLLAQGICPINEPGVKPAIVKGLKKGLFHAAESMRSGALPEIIFICVGTPGANDGSTDLSHVHEVFAQLAKVMRSHADFKTEVILRSTVPPGTLNHLQKLHPDLFAKVPVAFYPEFLREGTAMRDFHEPPQNVIGSLPSGHKPVKLPRLLAKLGLPGGVTRVDAVSAESLKLASNAYHALKICFANEVARVVSAGGGNAVEVMELFCRDTKLNISPSYLLPGNPYGGSCLSKDTKSLAHWGDRLGIHLNLIKNCETSNASHFDYLLEKIANHRPKVVALLGLSFKKHTDDIRNSPSVELIQRLLARGGYQIQAHDFLVNPEDALGLNKKLQDQLFAHAGLVLHRDVKKALEGVELVVIMHRDHRYTKLVADLRIPVLDVASWQGFGS